MNCIINYVAWRIKRKIALKRISELQDEPAIIAFWFSNDGSVTVSSSYQPNRSRYIRYYNNIKQHLLSGRNNEETV